MEEKEIKNLLAEKQESIEELSFLNRIIISAQKTDSLDSICEVIAKEISAFYPDSFVAFSLYDNELKGVRIRSIEGIGKRYQQFAKILGKDPKEMVFDAKQLDKTYEHYTTGKLIKVAGGLSELMKGQLPEFVCRQAEKLMHITTVYTVGFRDSDMAKGGIVLLMRNNHSVLNPQPIETALSYVSELLKRRLAENEIARKEILLRSSVESPLDIIILSLDKDYRYIYFNEVYKKVMKAAYGTTPVLGECIFDYINNKDDIQKIKERFDEGLQGKSTVSEDIYGVKEKRFYKVHINPILDNKKEIIGISSYSHDITETKRAKEELESAYQQLQANEQQLKASNQQLEASEQQLKAKEQELQIKNHKLSERLKEMGCLYRISRIVNDYDDVDKVLINLLKEIPSGWQFTSDTVSRIIFREKDYKSKNFIETKWKQKADIIVEGEKQGIIEVFYLEEKPVLDEGPFLKEERDLLNLIADALGRAIESIFKTKILFNSNQQLEASDQQLRAANQQLQANEQALIAAKEKAEESEEKYRALYQNAPLAYQSLNIDGEIIDVNPQWLKTLDFKRDDVIGSWFGDFLQADSREHFRANFKRFKEKGAVSGVEFKMKQSNGSEIIVSFEGCIGYDEKGNFKQTYCTFKDITKQKTYEQKLKQSDRVFNLSLDMFCIAGFDGYFKYLNPAWEKTLGWSVEELLSKPWLEFVYPEDVEKTKNVKSAIVDGKEIYQFENRYICKDGSIKWLSWNSQPFHNENIMIGAVRDITRSKEIEHELLKAKEKVEKNTEMILNSQSLAHICSYSTNLKEDDLEKSAWVCSPEFYKIFGIDETYPHTIAGWANFIHPDCREKLLAYHESVVKNKSSFNYEYRIIRINDGVERWVHGTGDLVYNKQGEPIRMHGAIQDITELKQTEDELIKAKEKAEESDRLKSAFLANMSHEIRTPMNGILGFTDLLKQPDLTGKQQKEYIDIIQKSGNRMLNTVNDIIEISKIETGQIKVSSKQVNISKHLLTLYNFFRLEAESKELKLILDNKLTEAETLIKTDKNKFGSIVSNLIKNAIKFTDKGSITIGCEKKGEFLEFHVTDTGIGIPANRTEAIFNRFEQADIEDPKAFQGSGLGLSITKSYVEMLGGEIWLESEEGIGSQFYFTLPHNTINLAFPEKNTENSNKPLSLKNGLKVLLAEDDETTITYLRIVLKEYEKEILIAKNGIEAVETCRNNPDIDMVLMDIKMPGLNGYEATQQIREFNKNVFILAQTAYAQSGDREKAIEVGCDDYISKPIQKDELFGKLNKFFKQ